MELKGKVNTIAFFNILSTVILQGITFFTSPIISRLLGTSNYGIVSVYNTWVSLFAIVFGLQTQSSLAVARNEFGEEEQNKYQSSILLLSISTYITLSLIVLSLLKYISIWISFSNTIVILALIHGFGQMVITFFNVKYTYEFKAKQNFAITLTLSLTTLGLSILLIKDMDNDINYMGRILGLTIPYIITGCTLSNIVIIKGRTFYNRDYWAFCLKLTIPIIVHSISNLILNQSDRVMLKYYLGDDFAGIYSLAYSFSAVLTALWTALNNTWVPLYYEYTRNREIGKLKSHAQNYLELFTVLASGFVLLHFDVYHLFADRNFWYGTNLIILFSIGFYFMFLYSFPVNYEFYNKKTKLIATGTIFSAIFNILLNIFLIEPMGIYGAAIATSISYALQFIFHYVSCKMIIKSADNIYPFGIKVFLPYFFGFALFILLSLVFTQFIVIRWMMGVLLGLWELIRINKRKSIF